MHAVRHIVVPLFFVTYSLSLFSQYTDIVDHDFNKLHLISPDNVEPILNGNRFVFNTNVALDLIIHSYDDYSFVDSLGILFGGSITAEFSVFADILDCTCLFDFKNIYIEYGTFQNGMKTEYSEFISGEPGSITISISNIDTLYLSHVSFQKRM